MSDLWDWFCDKAMAAGAWGDIAAVTSILLVALAMTAGVMLVALTPWLWLPTVGVAVFIVLMSFWKTFGPGR